MSKRQWFIAKFDDHSDYEAFRGDATRFVKPNVSHCVEDNHVHYNPIGCDESEERSVLTSYTPYNIAANKASFQIEVEYSSTSTTKDCSESYSRGTDYVTINCGENTTGSERVIEGNYDYYGSPIWYSVTQGA